MNTIITSREAILAESRKLVMEKGITAINMRTVACACGVAVGSIYNYFPSKAELLSATVEDVWSDIFHMSGEPVEFEHFTDCLIWLFERIRSGYTKYPEFFTLHSVSFTADDKAKGRQTMEFYFAHIKQSFMKVLSYDSAVRPDAFNENLTLEAFVDMVFTLIASRLLQRQEDCQPLLEIVARCIY